MDFELRRAREKLEKEQKERKEKARLRLERERKAKLEAVRQREASKLLKGLEGSMLPKLSSRIIDEGAFDKGPLYFKLSVIQQSSPSDPTPNGKETQRSTHSGVLEFTADEDCVALPPHVWNNLFPTATITAPLVEVAMFGYQKEFMQSFNQIELDFLTYPTTKLFLKTILRHHATLSENDLLTVNHGILTYKLRVLELKPASRSDAADQPYLKPLEFGKCECGVLDEGNYLYYKFSITMTSGASLSLGRQMLVLRWRLGKNEGDTDLYVSRHPLLFPTTHQHEWSSHDVGLKKTLIMTAKDKIWEPVLTPSECMDLRELSWEAKNHVHCEKCGKAFQQAELEKHVKVFHEPLQCPCGVFLEKEDMVQHQASDCPLRLITCRFCGDMVQAGNAAIDARDRMRGLSEHESGCGSRTAPCSTCGRSVMLKEMDIHQVAVHPNN
ncbi:unnamed protein product [Rhodiola kirilowii]